MKHTALLSIIASTTLLLCGCAGYQLGSAAPEELRTIHVPAFENQTGYPMVGAVAAQQFMDCLIEDGIFTPCDYDEARLRMQAIVKSCSTDSVRYDRNNLSTPTEYYLTITVELHVFDAYTGETYIKGKSISATDTMLTRNQYQTGVQDVIPRVARRLARNLVDELNSLEPKSYKGKKAPAPIREEVVTEEDEILEEDAEATDEENVEEEETANEEEAEEIAEEPAVEPVANDEAMAEAPAEEPATELPAEAEAPAEEVTPAEMPADDDDAMAETPAEEPATELPAEAEAPAEEVTPAEMPADDDDAMAEAPAEEPATELPAEAEAPAEEVTPAEMPADDDDAMAEAPAEEQA